MSEPSTPFNVEPTAEIIDKMADELESKTRDLRRIASEMRESKSFEGASEAASIVSQLASNMRVDLLVSRPLRALGVK